METPPGKPLSLREKEKLKEQLAFLKREYSKTFLRLQRAERAERVKNGVKKRAAEQNDFVPPKEAEKDCEEPISLMSPEANERVLAGAFREPSAAKATCVGLEPEAVTRGDGLPENSGSECSTPDSESGLFCPAGPRPERKWSRLSRSGTKARRRTAPASGARGESACDGLQGDAGRDGGCETASTGSSGSPIFKRRCSTLESKQSPPNPASVADGGGCGAVAQPETLGRNLCLGASSLLSDAWSHENEVPAPNSLGKEGVFANPEGPAIVKPVARDEVRCGEQDQVEKDQVLVGEEEPGGPAVGIREAFQGAGAAPCVSGHGVLECRGQCEETKTLDLDSGETSFLSKAGEMGLGGQGGAGPPILEEAVPAAPTESPLSSCTVVEGLLFPVEYYVRTTRRMSRCQREVDLAAVLQSQLGRRRRGQGASQKARGATPRAPSREPECPLGAAPVSPADASVGNGCDAASPLQPLPDAVGQGLPRPRRGRRSRGRPGCRASPGTLPKLPAPKDGHDLVSCEAQGQGAALPGRTCGNLEAQPTEPALAASRSPEAKSESVRSSCTTAVPETGSAISYAGDLDVSSVENLPCAGPGAGSAAGENLPKASLEEPRGSSPVQWPLGREGVPLCELLLSPAPEPLASQLESQLNTSVFPLVGVTPAFQPLPGGSPSQVKSKPEDGTRPRAGEQGEAAGPGLEESQSSAGQSVEHCKESPSQIDTAVETWLDDPGEGKLHMTAKLKASSSTCSVDLSAVWWGEAGSAEFCVAIACEASVSLWRCLGSGQWGVLHTWHFAEVPVSRIVPLPDVHSALCVALGGWEIAQIRFLFQSSADGGSEHSQVKAGDIKAVLGLKDRRLVVGCGSPPNQTIEVIFFSEAGRSQKRRSLMPPKENISTFAEVDGLQEALVGLTAANCVVIWNLITGQLLRRIPVGQPDSALVCHKTFSNSGLLFVVLSCPHAKESEADGTAAFQVIALNPKTARSTGVALLSLPRGITGRCVEGNVRGTSAAAVLTSGTIAVWDLPKGRCTALLPPSSEGSWSLARWATAGDCLLARRTDGSVCLYSYAARLPCS